MAWCYIRQQAVTCANADPELCCHMKSPGHNELSVMTFCCQATSHCLINVFWDQQYHDVAARCHCKDWCEKKKKKKTMLCHWAIISLLLPVCPVLFINLTWLGYVFIVIHFLVSWAVMICYHLFQDNGSLLEKGSIFWKVARGALKPGFLAWTLNSLNSEWPIESL